MGWYGVIMKYLRFFFEFQYVLLSVIISFIFYEYDILHVLTGSSKTKQNDSFTDFKTNVQ